MPLTISEIRNRFIDYYDENADPMRFVDLTKPDHSHHYVSFPKKTMEEYLEIEYVGGGAFASVYDIGNNRVLKVCTRKDYGYHGYIEACKMNRGNPHMPKVFYSGVWADRYVYILEKLLPLDDDLKDFVVQYCRRAARNYGEPPVVSPLLNPSSFGQGLIDACQTVSSLIGSDHKYCMDIHGGNIMVHASGRIVLTDPLTHQDT